MTNFHIHIDATRLSREFEEYLAATGFVRTDFAGHPEGEQGFEAPNHLTLKLSDARHFREQFDNTVAYASKMSGMNGYIEGEFIPLDKDVVERTFTPGIPLPFSITTVALPKGAFRETEIHITLDRDRSDPRLRAALSDMGFFSAFMRKPHGVAQIFTVQGSREHVGQILPPLIDFLDATGGTVHCSVKEERIAKWWLSDPSVVLPPVINSIQWRRE
jgi:hypothetical protein